MKAKKLTAAFLCALTVLFAMAGAVYATDGPTVERVAGAYLYNFENDVVLYELNANTPIFPASTVKIMSGIIAIEALGDDPDRTITVTGEMLTSVSGNNIGLVAGEIVSVRDMLAAMLTGGNNDAAAVLAYTAAGSIDAFVARMNDRAAALGATSTHYTNVSGMHNASMITTVSDIAIIAKYAYTIPLFMELTSEKKYVMEATNVSEYRNIYNRNYMIAKNLYTRYYYEGAEGINAGSTTQAGYAVVTTCRQSGLTYLAIAMGGEEDSDDGTLYNYVAAANLLDWAFASYSYIEVLKDSMIVCEMPVELSSALDYVTLVPEESIILYLPTDTNLDTDVTYSYTTLTDTLTAPVAEGQSVGMITVLMKGEMIGTVNLVTTSAVSRSEFLYAMDGIKKFASGKFFIATAVSAVVLCVLYVAFSLLRTNRRDKKRRKYR